MMRVFRDDELLRTTVLSAEFVARANPDGQFFVNAYVGGLYGSHVGFFRGVSEMAARAAHEKPVYRIVVRPH